MTRSLPLLVLAAVASFSALGCVPPEVEQPLGQPTWPATPDEVDVRPSLKDWLRAHSQPKVVLRVPRALTNVTQAENASTGGDHAYDLVEKALFKKGYTVRDRAMLASLLKDDKITSYKEIKSRVDTDLIIEISSLRFNEPGDFIKTSSYENGEGPLIGSAVATMEAKVVNVETGEVGALATLRLPLCLEPEACQGRGETAGSGDPSAKLQALRAAKKARRVPQAAGSRGRGYTWKVGGDAPNGMDIATNKLAAKLLAALTP